MQKLSLWQRLCSATPLFFQRVQLLALGVAGLGGTLATIHGIPSSLTASMISAGTAVAAIAQFAVKQMNSDNSSENNETK
ncbi:MAG TPA: hypothetical protein VG367_17445 [Mucilaginibacter sp.]|jgi:phosphate/sulfate permease|nr:hypothetical protein [Mucilaginibacter sp.]